MKNKTKMVLPVLLAFAIAASCAVQYLCYRFDNRYTCPRPAAEAGKIRLNTEWYDSSPFFYIVDGWAFYDGKLLSPEEIQFHAPDDHFYIGRYGGLNRGDMERSAKGQATYRMVIETDKTPRSFALELSGVYDRWRLWVNGDLLQSVGYDDGLPSVPIVGFTASEAIELVVAVESEGDNFYSGMVSPPALGSPDRVQQLSRLRLLIHAGTCAAAMLLCVLCLLFAAGRRGGTPFVLLAMLAFFVCGVSAWPMYREWNLIGGFAVWERMSHYGVFLALILVQNRICNMPKWPSRISGGTGLLVCCAMVLRPFLSFGTAEMNFIWSRGLTIYKWMAAIYLLACAVWALRRGTRHSAALLAGCCAFAAALVMNRLLPLHEPILLGWNIEIAGFGWLCLLAAIIGADTARAYRERTALEAEQAVNRAQLAVRAEYARIQQEYVRLTREHLHESRSRLTLIRHYLHCGEYARLENYLEQLTQTAAPDSRQYTGNSLVDAILTISLIRAEGLHSYVQQEFSPLPEVLPIGDADLTGLLLNIIENALEALERIGNPDDRWLRLRLEMEGNSLVVECENAIVPGEKNIAKADPQAHGFGLSIIREIAAKYGGEVRAERNEDSYISFLKLYS